MYKRKFLNMCITAILYPGTQPRWERDIDDQIAQMLWCTP